MAAEIIPDQIFMLILVLILAVVVIIVVSQWKKVSQSNNTLKLMEKEIELKIQLPKEQQEQLTQIRDSTAEVMSNVGYLHSEINERLARLEAQTELKKLEKMLKEIEAKEKKLNKDK